MLRAFIKILAVVSPMKVKLKKVIGMGVFDSGKGTVSNRWALSVFPTEGQSVGFGTVKVPNNCKNNHIKAFHKTCIQTKAIIITQN